MKVVYSVKEPITTQRVRIYTCSGCGEKFTWDKDSRWYGSELEMENNPNSIPYYCHKKCMPKIKESQLKHPLYERC